MPHITDLVLEYLNPRKQYLWILFVIIVLLIAAVYVYRKNTHKNPENRYKGDVPNASNGDDLHIMFFKVDWCPHCTKALPDWENFKEGYHNKRFGETLVTCVEYNCTKKDQSDPDYKLYANATANQQKYDVDGYPTVKMIKGGQVIDFDAKITTYALEKFVENMLN